MGLTYADIEIVSGDDLVLRRRGFIEKDKVKKLTVKMLVDSGAYMLTINETIKAQLDLQVIGTQIAELANGEKVKVDIVGPVDVRFENRRANVDAVVFPGDVEPLLGAIPMEDMDVMIDPKQQKLIVNPDHPILAQKPLK